MFTFQRTDGPVGRICDTPSCWTHDYDGSDWQGTPFYELVGEGLYFCEKCRDDMLAGEQADTPLVVVAGTNNGEGGR